MPETRFGGFFAFEGLIPETLGNAPSLQALKAVLRITTSKGCFINYNVSYLCLLDYSPISSSTMRGRSNDAVHKNGVCILPLLLRQ